MLEIKMARGDMLSKSFVIRTAGDVPYTDVLDNVYFTVKKSENDYAYKFQKRLSDGGIQYMGDGKYEFTIMPEDTNGLPFGNYVFDIELKKAGMFKRTYFGTFTLTKEVTHQNNEVEAG